MSDYHFDQLAATAPPFTDDGQIWYRARINGVSGHVHLRLGVASDGQYVCTGLAVDSPDGIVTTSALKQIHISRLISQILKSLGSGDNPDPASRYEPEVPPTGETGMGASVIWEPTLTVGKPAPRRGGKGPAGPDLEKFASTYQAALNHPLGRSRPMEWTAQRLNIGVSTAHRWRKKCQEAGLLEARI